MLIKKMFQRCAFLNKCYIQYKWQQRKVSYGRENPDKVFYVIRRATCKVGLFSFVMTNLGHIKFAIDHGYIPVIDMQNNANTYLEKNEIGKKNAWEFYFEQPCGYSLADISKSKNVILGSGLITDKIAFPSARMVYDENEFNLWKGIFDQYLNITEEIKREVDRQFEQLFHNNRVLGVLARGTDYTGTKPHKHPVQPETEQIISKSKEVMNLYKCDKIYLATEDEQIFCEFKRVFGDKLTAPDVKRYMTIGAENINDVMCEDRKCDKYLKGKEYLESILLLSKCNCLVAGNTGGTQGALLFSKGYEYKYIFDLGVYQ